MGSKDESNKSKTRDGLIEFLDSIGSDEGGELEVFARRVGAVPLTLLGAAGPDKTPVEVMVRPISHGAELCVASAIPRPAAPMTATEGGEPQPDYADSRYLDLLTKRNAVFDAGIAALAIDLQLADGRGYRRPGTHAGGANTARTNFVRDAAKFMIQNHTGDEIARILKTFGEISDPGGLIDKAGEPSAPISATSKKTPESGVKKAQASSPTSSPPPAPTDRDS